MTTEETIKEWQEKFEDSQEESRELREETVELAKTIEGLEGRLRESLKLLYPFASPYELNLYMDGAREIGLTVTQLQGK